MGVSPVGMLEDPRSVLVEEPLITRRADGIERIGVDDPR
jgi:hypothetical protein